MERKASTVLRERDTPTSSLLRAEDSRLGGGCNRTNRPKHLRFAACNVSVRSVITHELCSLRVYCDTVFCPVSPLTQLCPL